MGANGILGAGAPLICGAALAAKFRGARGEMGAHLAARATARRTRAQLPQKPESRPVGTCRWIFVIENNGYAESTSREDTARVYRGVDRAGGLRHSQLVTVDGTTICFAVHDAAGEAK